MTTILVEVHSPRLTVAAIRHDDWCALRHGHLEFRLDGRSVNSRVMQLAMPDGSAVWLREDGTHEQRFYAKSDGYSAWISPRDLPPGEPASKPIELMAKQQTNFHSERH
jgi:hypothetical protein